MTATYLPLSISFLLLLTYGVNCTAIRPPANQLLTSPPVLPLPPPLLPPPTNLTLPNHPPKSPLSVWPTLPWWTKLQNTAHPAFLDIYSVGRPATPTQAYALQELVLIPLSFQVHRGHGPAANAEEISVGNLTARYEPVENRAPSRDVAAKAIAALTVSEKNFGAREVKGGLRVGLLSVAELFVTIGDGGVEGA